MLKGKRLILREWREPDLPTLAAIRNDVELQSSLMAMPRPNSIERVRQWLVDRTSREDMQFFVIASSDDDCVLGYVQVTQVDFSHGSGELGICLARNAQGSGLAHECCDLLEGHLSRMLALRKLTLKVLSTNTRAISFYLRRGYREVGRFEQHFRVNGMYQDVVLMERFLRQ